MPFNFLKKSRHYNVTSKNLFVISVHHLLDTSATVDCTLSSESTGQECLDNVCQRLSINQPEIFGLRYISKASKDDLRWIDLDRPLSRQLEKHASSLKLHLRVMYYVMSGVSLLEDEVSRYYYFLQLKNDIVEGRIVCDAKQAVMLAYYCRQAEYDVFQKDKQTIDCLKSFLPFPKHLVEEGLQEALVNEVLQQNMSLQNLTQSAAEELFIAACQQLDGYGQEKFLVKDPAANEVQLGITVNGIAVCYRDRLKFYPWHEISNVVNLKRTFNIECENTVSFIFPDAESGRYFWKLCVLHHTFYMKYEKNQTQQCPADIFGSNHPEMHNSREDIADRNVYLLESHASDVQSSVKSSTISLAPSQTIYPGIAGSSWTHLPAFEGSSTQNVSQIENTDSRLQSTSCLDLSNNNFPPDRQQLKTLLPNYRPAPDYEMALQQKYHRASSNEINHQGTSHIMLANDIRLDLREYSGSQPDIEALSAKNRVAFLHQPYPDVTHTQPLIQNSIYNGSSLYTNIDVANKFHMIKLKPPPPYPANRLSSTSTPDLAIATRNLLGYRGAYVSGSSPDLVSSRTIYNGSYIPYHLNPIGMSSQPYLPHGTFENLNMIQEQPSVLLPLKPIPKNPYDKTIYRFHHSEEPRVDVLHPRNYGSIEPIYENVPFAWNKEETTTTERQRSTEMRDRTSSIQSAPGGTSNETLKLNRPQRPINEINNVNMVPPPMDNVEQLLKVKHLEISKRKIDSNTTRSQTESILNSTKFSDYQNESNFSMSITASTDSQISAGKEKRKRRWGILGRSKNSAEKQKSATLGREKSKSKDKDKSEVQQDGVNLRHRWSTGLPRLQPLSATYSKDKLCQILDSKLNDPQLFLEFERIPKRRESARYECALMEENRSKNSDPNFLPYDENRVRITPTMENRTGYVNASHITATVGTNQRFYIIAQSPSDANTSNFFWQCVWEADVYLIVQLSDDSIYMPNSTSKRLEFGQFQIFHEFSQTSDRCTTSKLRIYHQQSRRYRSVWHLNFLEWVEQNCPKDVGRYLDFLEELSSVRLASINEVPPGHNTNPPVLIHCSEGGGRSGYTLAADLLLYTLDHNQDLDIPRVIGHLRQQRDNVVPSLAQYKFIYALLITYLKRTRLI